MQQWNFAKAEIARQQTTTGMQRFPFLADLFLTLSHFTARQLNKMQSMRHDCILFCLTKLSLITVDAAHAEP